MALPNRKRTQSRKGIKQYQFRLKKKQLSKCPKCGKAVAPHRACSFCGFYLNREVFQPKIKKTQAHKEHKHQEDNKEHKK